MISIQFYTALALWFVTVTPTESFQCPKVIGLAVTSTTTRHVPSRFQPLFEASSDDGVVELVDDDELFPVPVSVSSPSEPSKQVAPFLSQGEISEDAMEMDLSDPKQARVIFYIVLSLLPVLFLVPLMLGSREMIPAEMLPPVQLN